MQIVWNQWSDNSVGSRPTGEYNMTLLQHIYFVTEIMQYSHTDIRYTFTGGNQDFFNLKVGPVQIKIENRCSMLIFSWVPSYFYTYFFYSFSVSFAITLTDSEQMVDVSIHIRQGETVICLFHFLLIWNLLLKLF